MNRTRTSSEHKKKKLCEGLTIVFAHPLRNGPRRGGQADPTPTPPSASSFKLLALALHMENVVLDVREFLPSSASFGSYIAVRLKAHSCVMVGNSRVLPGTRPASNGLDRATHCSFARGLRKVCLSSRAPGALGKCVRNDIQTGQR